MTNVRHPTKTLVGASPLTIPNAGSERRTLIHKVHSGGANVIADSTGTLWSGPADDLFHAPLRSQAAGSDVTITGTGSVSVQFSYEGA